MDADETAVDVFTTRVRQMILQYKELKLQNAQLCSAIDALKADVSSLEEQLRKQREEYTNLKLARMVAGTPKSSYSPVRALMPGVVNSSLHGSIKY